MARMGDDGVLPILRGPIEGMTQHDLRVMIPQIIRNTTGLRPQYGNQKMKPKWWPWDLPFCNPQDDFRDPLLRKKPWMDVLRSIIENCYQYYGQEHLLRGATATNKESPIKVVNNQNGSVSFITHMAVVTLEDRQNTPYASYPPAMEAATPGRSLSASTGAAEPIPTGLYQSSPQPKPPTAKRRISPVQAKSSEKPFVEVFMCFFCEKEFGHKMALQQHQKECIKWPKHFSRTTSSIRTRGKPEPLKIVPRKPRKLIVEKVTFPAKGVYIESLGLLPQAKAESVRRESQCYKPIDCDVIEIDESKPPKTPTTPRTPKSLISQLSRDLSPPARVRLKVCDSSTEDTDDVGNTEDDSSDEDSDSGKERDHGYRPRRAASLLTIDISSPLGERVKKHITKYFENLETYQTSPDASNKNYENFCRTPTKAKVTERLRSRGKDTFQVTFKKTKRTAPAHYHTYKFRRSELGEFCRIVETGLNRRGRALKRQVKKCKVVLHRLSPEVIEKWTQRKKPASVQRTIPNMFKHANGRPSVTAQNTGYASQRLKQMLTSSGDGSVQQMRLIGNNMMNQQTMLFNNLLSANMQMQTVMSNSPADLTPPSTPEDSPIMEEDDDLICLDDSNSFEQTSSTQTSPIAARRATNSGYDGGYARNGYDADRKRKACNNFESPISANSADHIVICDSQDDDVISISSSDSAELTVVSPESLKRVNSHSHAESDLPAKRRRIDQLRPSALLFRCHLCFEEITCHDNANHYIKSHFATAHNVYNIDLIEHIDANGQSVVSIVEVPNAESLPPPSSFYLSARMAVPGNPAHTTGNNQAAPKQRVRHKPAILQKKRDYKAATPPPTKSSASLTSKDKVVTKIQNKDTKSVNNSRTKPTNATTKPVTDKKKSNSDSSKPAKKGAQIKVVLKVKKPTGTAPGKPNAKTAATKVNNRNVKSRTKTSK